MIGESTTVSSEHMFIRWLEMNGLTSQVASRKTREALSSCVTCTFNPDMQLFYKPPEITVLFPKGDILVGFELYV